MQFKNLKCSMEEEKKRSKRSKTIFFLFSLYLKKKIKQIIVHILLCLFYVQYCMLV